MQSHLALVANNHSPIFVAILNYVHPTGGDILFLLCPASDLVSGHFKENIYPIFTKFGMGVYWVNSLHGIAFGEDSSIAK